MKYLVTGSTGMLGREVAARLAGSEAHFAGRDTIDLEAPERIHDTVRTIRPNVILHLAAETDVDLCERQPARAGVKNHLATAALATAARDFDAQLIYVSTSNVFGADGRLRYNELDMPAPSNYYGRSKLAGERAVETICAGRALVVRAGWMIGGGRERDHKFVGKIVQQIGAGATSLRAVSDKFGSITRASLLSEFLLWAAQTGQTGTLHFASSGMVSRYSIAQFIASYFGFDGEVEPVQSAEFPLSAPRPTSECLDSIYLPRLHAAPRPGDWQRDLAAYLDSFR